MKRRAFLVGGAALAAGAALPLRSFAQPAAGSVRDRKLFALAKQQMDRAGTAIWRRDIAGIADFGLRSSEPRFHFVDLQRQTVTSHLVSHGAGSDPEHDGWLDWFSNQPGSNATSRGAYVTWEWYQGRYGTSVRLGGLDPTNDNALRRYIVMHHAPYAEPSHLERWGRLGRSNGCFAMGEDEFRLALLNLSGGRLLYAGNMGLAADGSTVSAPGPQPERDDLPVGGEDNGGDDGAPPPVNLKPLVPEGPTGEKPKTQRIVLPDVY